MPLQPLIARRRTKQEIGPDILTSVTSGGDFHLEIGVGPVPFHFQDRSMPIDQAGRDKSGYVTMDTTVISPQGMR
jgi:hypothetical protein